MYVDSWKVMRQGDLEKALRQMRENFEEQWKLSGQMPSCTSETMELGVASLWVHQYSKAWELLDKYNQRYPKHADCTYAMAGVAKWCLDERKGAVAQWQEGLDVDYGDTAGLNIKPSLLLFFASVLEPESFSKEQAKDLLVKKAADSRSVEWPLVQFVLGELEESALREKSISDRWWKKDPRREEERLLHEWQADFWAGIIEFSRGNKSRYRELMGKVGNVTWDDFDNNSDFFLSKLWMPEFHLAKHECKKHAAT